MRQSAGSRTAEEEQSDPLTMTPIKKELKRRTAARVSMEQAQSSGTAFEHDARPAGASVAA
jgi:hypothetical protein